MGRKGRIRILKNGEYGQAIYAYLHQRTNQVVYSLDRSLRNGSTLKQLPDLGANNKPVTVRKDLWRPYLTICFPRGQAAQGLDAFRRLREYRKLHETSWEPSPLLSRPFSEEEKEVIEEKMDRKQGSKKEKLIDVMRRMKKQMRVKEVMDQKANSVADLAQVLIEQEDLGANFREEREETEEREQLESTTTKEELKRKREIINRENELAEMRRLAQEWGNGLGATLEEQTVQSKTALAAAKNASEKTKLLRHLDKLRRDRDRAIFARKAVSKARREAQDKAQKLLHELSVSYWEGHITLAKTRLEAAEKAGGHPNASLRKLRWEVHRLRREQKLDNELEKKGEKPLSPVQAAAIKDDIAVEYIDWHSELPSFPKSTPPVPRRGRAKQLLKRSLISPYTTEGVSIRWSNILDAEFAEQWPENVEHGLLGFARHVAPRPDSNPVLDAETFKRPRARMVGVKMSKREEKAVERDVAKEVVRRIEAMAAGKEAVEKFEWRLPDLIVRPNVEVTKGRAESAAVAATNEGAEGGLAVGAEVFAAEERPGQDRPHV